MLLKSKNNDSSNPELTQENAESELLKSQEKMKKFNIVSIIILAILCIPLLWLATRSNLASTLWIAILIAIIYTYIDIWVMVNTKEFKNQNDIKKFSDIFNRFFQDLGSPMAMIIIGYAIAKL